MTEDRAVLSVRLRHVLSTRLAAVVVAHQNIVVCGVVGAGKTSLLRPVMNQEPPGQRLVRP